LLAPSWRTALSAPWYFTIRQQRRRWPRRRPAQLRHSSRARPFYWRPRRPSWRPWRPLILTASAAFLTASAALLAASTAPPRMGIAPFP